MEVRGQLSEVLEYLERNINKELAKLKYYMDLADKLIGNSDCIDMEIAIKQDTQ